MEKQSGAILTTPFRSLVCLIVMAVFLCAASWAEPVIGVDPAGIRALKTDPPLTKAEQDAVLAKMMATIKENLDEAFGSGSTVVKEWPEPKPPPGSSPSTLGVSADPPPTRPDRTVTTHPTNPTRSTPPPSNEHYHPWGEANASDSDVDVYAGKPVKEYPSTFKKPDGSWDTDKLGTALGHIAAHEIAHTYSCPHTKGGVSKMDSSHSAGKLAGDLHFGPNAKKILQANRGTPPCAQAIANSHMLDAVAAQFYTMPGFPTDEDPVDLWWIDAGFSFGGPLANNFVLGWWGADTDNGLLDGNELADFVFKTTMEGGETDVEMLTFFDKLPTYFVLQGAVGTPYEGQRFDLQPANIALADIVTRPDGLLVGRQVDMQWDVNTDGLIDVTIHLDTQCYGEDSPEFSGFTIGPPSPLTIPEAKHKIDGNYIALTGSIVTAVFAGKFYVESQAGMGIAVEWMGPPPLEGSVVGVQGKTETTPNGERAIQAWTIAQLSPGEAKPVAMTNKSVGGGSPEYVQCRWPNGQQGVEGGIGMNTIGKLVRIWGNCTDVTPTSFVLNDGSGQPVKCVTPPEVVTYPFWTYVAATGVCSCETTETGLKPVLLIRRQSDIYGLP